MVKNPSANVGDVRDAGLIVDWEDVPGGGHGKLIPVFLPGEAHGQKRLAGYSP